ncbi:MAG TPA: prolipoprotein diacylglyceryl transferase family protein, partial [Aquabacterium sp.]|nr:prolipoprotein diacylglyceryl transferase family protein [Aquabacterium sp.]
MLIHPHFNPIAVTLGPLKVHWYGLMYLVGFVAFYFLANRRAQR